MAKVKDTNGGSWRQIRQSAPRGNTTKVARQRRLVILFRGAVVLLLLVAIVTGIFAIRYFGRMAAEKAAASAGAAPVEVSFQSNGVLTEEWFLGAFPGIRGMSVRQVDVRTLKDQLEARGQVAAASVTVSLPSLLKVQLEEREPVLRLRVRGEDGNPQTLLIARDGTIYEGALYPLDTLQRLPGVAGLRVQRDGQGFRRVDGLDKVARLLDLAKERLPALYRHWRIVDLSDWNPDLSYRPSLVRITSTHIDEIVFSSEGLEEQIERLAGILRHVQRYQLGQPKFIDLSYGEEAVIRYK